MSSRIRPLAPADAAAYKALRLQLLRESPNAFITTAAEYAERDLAGIAQRLTPDPQHVTFGAWVGGELVGVVTLTREVRPRMRHRATIYAFGVLAQARGQGLGRQLMEAATAYARELGTQMLLLDVMETQASAVRLYGALGFQTWGYEPDVLRTAEGEYIGSHAMWLDLR